MKPLYLALISTSLIFQLGCTKDEEKVQTPTNNNLISYSLEIPASDEEIANEELKALVSNINQKNKVSFKQITSLYIASHADEYGTSTGEQSLSPDLSKYISDISAGLDANKYFELKPLYEAKHKEQLGSDSAYNLEAVTMAHIAKENRQQCFSGTALNLTVSRNLLSGTDYRNSNFVVIFEKGHVLPGKIQQEGKNFRLMGVESTKLGRAAYDYGLTNALQGEVLIVDAEYFVLGQLLRDSMSAENAVKFRKDVLEYTADRYNIELVDISTRSGSGSGSGSGAADGSDEKSFNASLWAFGEVEVEEGDRDRTESSDDLRTKSFVTKSLVAEPTQYLEQNLAEAIRKEAEAQEAKELMGLMKEVGFSESQMFSEEQLEEAFYKSFDEEIIKPELSPHQRVLNNYARIEQLNRSYFSDKYTFKTRTMSKYVHEDVIDSWEINDILWMTKLMSDSQMEEYSEDSEKIIGRSEFAIGEQMVLLRDPSRSDAKRKLQKVLAYGEFTSRTLYAAQTLFLLNPKDKASKDILEKLLDSKVKYEKSTAALTLIAVNPKHEKASIVILDLVQEIMVEQSRSASTQKPKLVEIIMLLEPIPGSIQDYMYSLKYNNGVDAFNIRSASIVLLANPKHKGATKFLNKILLDNEIEMDVRLRAAKNLVFSDPGHELARNFLYENIVFRHYP